MKNITLTKTTGGSFKCVLPKEYVESLGWKDKDILKVSKGSKLITIKKEDENSDKVTKIQQSI